MIQVVSPKKIPMLRMKQMLTKLHPLYFPIFPSFFCHEKGMADVGQDAVQLISTVLPAGIL